MTLPMGEAQAVAKGLSEAQREAWRNAEWETEYFVPPDLPASDGPLMRRLGLLDGTMRDGSVTTLGEHLIIHLREQARPWWVRLYVSVRDHLKGQS